MRLTSVVTLSAALLLSSAAYAQDKQLAANEQPSAGAAYQARTDAPAAAPEEKKICKRLAVSGTRMADRVCRTTQQWQTVEEEAK